MQADLAQLREGMVEQALAASSVTSSAVAEALRAVPRHVFLPGLPPASAYRDEAIVTKRDADGHPISSSSQPAIMAVMLVQLGLKPGHRVLEIGTGTGYNAALMKHMVGSGGAVVSIDIDADLTEQARAHLAEAGYPGVTAVCADGAEGFAAQAPYDRVIATVGVSDLAPAWLAQAAPGARIVAPLDLRGTQRSVAFERADGHWRSRSVVPCGFMRMRGAQAGPERILVIDSRTRLSIMLPEGRQVGGQALATWLARTLAGPAAEHPSGVKASFRQLFDGLTFWLAVHEPRWCALQEEHSGPAPGQSSVPEETSGPRLSRAPGGIQDRRMTIGILGGDSLAVLAREHPAREHPAPGNPAPGNPGQGNEPPQSSPLSALGYGPDGDGLARELAAHLRAWDAAGRPATDGLRVDAYPRPEPGPERNGSSEQLVIERPHTRFVVYRDAPPSPSL